MYLGDVKWRSPPDEHTIAVIATRFIDLDQWQL
ncbi:hypothetical protein RS9916_31977 [Synechococcus sp. RS9916]|nr:hypothetical protein RS9916_31977 [Synechococcus sp. RS9916]